MLARSDRPSATTLTSAWRRPYLYNLVVLWYLVTRSSFTTTDCCYIEIYYNFSTIPFLLLYSRGKVSNWIENRFACWQLSPNSPLVVNGTRQHLSGVHSSHTLAHNLSIIIASHFKPNVATKLCFHTVFYSAIINYLVWFHFALLNEQQDISHHLLIATKQSQVKCCSTC